MLERMNKYIVPAEDSNAGCTGWTGGKDFDGYPIFWVNGKSRKAHTILWDYVYGPRKKGDMICHKCDNPECLNLNHLYLGNAQTNARDAFARGRKPNAVLNKEKLCLIRGLLKAKKPTISIRQWAGVVAPLFNVSPHTLRAIASNTTWSWL